MKKFILNITTILTFFVALPTLIIIYNGEVNLAGELFWLLFFFSFFFILIFKGIDRTMTFVMSLMPLIMILREYAFFNIIIVIFLFLLFLASILSTHKVYYIFTRYRVLVVFLFFLLVYYFFSFINTHLYSTNIRFFELFLSVFTIVWIYQNKKNFNNFLRSYLVISILYGMILLKYLDEYGRLGGLVIQTTFGASSIGNPIHIGMITSFGLFTLIIYDKKAELFGKKLKYIFSLLFLILLILSTSRAGWLMTIVGFIVFAYYTKEGRKNIFRVIVALSIGLFIISLTPYEKWVEAGFERTFSSDKSLKKRTSGRSDQWLFAWYIFTQPEHNMLLGVGPGMSSSVYQQKSSEYDTEMYGSGKSVLFHSLYLHLFVELGALSMLILFLFYGHLLLRAKKIYKRFDEIFPMVNVIAYILLVVSVIGFDSLAAIFLGTGIAGLEVIHNKSF